LISLIIICHSLMTIKKVIPVNASSTVLFFHFDLCQGLVNVLFWGFLSHHFQIFEDYIT
jgi:hypothetical protein